MKVTGDCKIDCSWLISVFGAEISDDLITRKLTMRAGLDTIDNFIAGRFQSGIHIDCRSVYRQRLFPNEYANARHHHCLRITSLMTFILYARSEYGDKRFSIPSSSTSFMFFVFCFCFFKLKHKNARTEKIVMSSICICICVFDLKPICSFFDLKCLCQNHFYCIICRNPKETI